MKKEDYIINQKLLFVILGLGFVFMIISPYLFTRNALLPSFGFSDNTGQIGDTIGGLTAPFANLIGAGLVLYSFLAQQRANKLQYDSLMTEIEQNKLQSNYKLINELLSDCKFEFRNDKIFSGDTISNTYNLLNIYKANSFTTDYGERAFLLIINDFNYLGTIADSIKTYELEDEQKKIICFKINNFLNTILSSKVTALLTEMSTSNIPTISKKGNALIQKINTIQDIIGDYIEILDEKILK